MRVNPQRPSSQILHRPTPNPLSGTSEGFHNQVRNLLGIPTPSIPPTGQRDLSAHFQPLQVRDYVSTKVIRKQKAKWIEEPVEHFGPYFPDAKNIWVPITKPVKGDFGREITSDSIRFYDNTYYRRSSFDPGRPRDEIAILDNIVLGLAQQFFKPIPDVLPDVSSRFPPEELCKFAFIRGRRVHVCNERAFQPQRTKSRSTFRKTIHPQGYAKKGVKGSNYGYGRRQRRDPIRLIFGG